MSFLKNIAIFGGTFDPVHAGHLDIAQKARNHCALDEVIFIPCRQSPHKMAGPAASDAQRLAMLNLATENLPWASVNSLELKAPPPSYTWKTIETLRAQYPPDTRFHLLIGRDQWESFPRWQRASQLAASLHLIVVGRGGQPSPRPGYEATFIHGEHPASASAIRAQIAQGKTPAWLPEKIARYIQRHQLYSLSES